MENDAISRSAVLEEINEMDISDCTDVDDIISKAYATIAHAPALDVAPVVRCGDCVHAAELEGYPKRRFENGLNCMACRGDNGYGIANLSLTTPDGYCDDGVLRWDGEDE